MGRVPDYDQPPGASQAAHAPPGDAGQDAAQREPHGEWGQEDLGGGEEGRGGEQVGERKDIKILLIHVSFLCQFRLVTPLDTTEHDSEDQKHRDKCTICQSKVK